MINPTRRGNDQHLMDIAQQTEWTDRQLKQINNCRVYLQVTTVAEIATARGEALQEQAIEFKSTTSRSTQYWPVQQRPGKDARAIWKKFLATLSYPSNKLQQSLGQWTNTDNRTWPNYYDETNNCIYSKAEAGWTVLKINNKTRNSWKLQKTGEIRINISTLR